MVLVRRLPNDFFESNNFLSYLVKWLSVCLREQIYTFFFHAFSGIPLLLIPVQDSFLRSTDTSGKIRYISPEILCRIMGKYVILQQKVPFLR